MTSGRRKFVGNSRRVGGFGWLLGVVLAFACEKQPAPAREPQSSLPSETLYDGKLGPGWSDQGPAARDLTHGAAHINLTDPGGFVLLHARLTASYGSLSFRMRAPAAFADFLSVQVADGDADSSRPVVEIGTRHESALPDSWVAVSVPWSELNPSGAPFDRLRLKAFTAVTSEQVQFDEIKFLPAVGAVPPNPSLASDTEVPPVPPLPQQPSQPQQPSSPQPQFPVASVKLAADCRVPGHAISPYIYGIAGDEPGLSPTGRRWGGNPTTRYNWQIGNVFNAGKDWFFSNQKSEEYRAFLSANRARQLLSALTVPTIGWVAKDASSYGFPVSVYGAQKNHDPYRPDAGDGEGLNGKPIAPKAPSQTSVEATPAMIQKWIETIVAEDRKTGKRSVGLYFLDNEPSLWNSTHRDVHPEPLSYDELLDRTIRYGTAIRTADPSALIAGPAEWGWLGYFFSARDVASGLNAKPDRLAHGDVPLIPWYLKKLSEHAQSSGKRLLDVLDVHYYPQAQSVYGDASDPDTAALRIRSTRSLWDPTYKDESWIKDTIRLVPRLKEWVQGNYPGLAISIGEYNFGGEKHISGALALAEVLGRFGTTGVDYAFYWRAPPKDSPAYWAFRAFRNFDGKNGQFLGRSVETQMAGGVSLFASRDENGKHMVLIALNLDPNTAANATIDLNGCGVISSRRDYAYGRDARSLAAAPPNPTATAEGAHAFQKSLAPYSINVFDIVLK